MARLSFWRNKGKAAPPAPPPAPKGRHASIAANDPYSFQASHRRLAWMCRLLTATVIVLGAGQVVSLQTISALVPLKEKEFVFVRTYGADDRTYQIEPISKQVDGFDLFLEATARRFIRILLAIDPVTQEERLREASKLSSSAYWEQFRKERITSGQIRDALDRGVVRKIDVETINRVASLTNDYKFAIDFIQTDTINGRPLGHPQRLRAYLSLITRPQKDVPVAEKYTNPFGLTVTGLVLRKRNPSGAGE
jgi:type IV secretion system protein VirB8